MLQTGGNEMKQRTLAYILLFSLLISIFAGCTKGPEQDSEVKELVAGDSTAATDGNWSLTKEWTVTREDSGAETLTVTALEDSTAWNTFFKLYEDWTVSASMQLLEHYGDTDCLRLVFGDAFNNIQLVVSAEIYGETVLLKADALTDNGWKTVYEADEWVSFDSAAPMQIKVVRDNGASKLALTLEQNDVVLHEGKTRTVAADVLSAINRPGFSIYHGQASFSSLAVRAARPSNRPDEVVQGIFEADEHVPTEDWIFGEGAVHNLIDGESAIVIDGQGERLAWNSVTDLSVDQWTLTMDVEFGKSYRDSVCSRFIFGASAEVEGNVVGLFTVNYVNGTVDFAAQVKEGGGWITTATSMGWLPVSSRGVQVQFVKYKDINRIAIFLYDHGVCIYSTFTDEMEQSQIDSFKRFGCMVYSSQVRFSGFRFEETADESIMPSMTEKVYPSISMIEVPEGQKTSDWTLSRNAIYFTDNGAPGLYINSKGEEFSYYTARSIRGAWSFSSIVDFGKYYSDTAGIRIAFKNTDDRFAALLTVKYSPGGNNIEANLQTYVEEIDDWNDVMKSGWQMGGPSFLLEMSGDESGAFTLRILKADGSKVIYENTITLEEAVVKNMQVIALSPMTSEVKYSDMNINFTGPAVSVNISSGDSSNKTMYPIYTATPVSTDLWTMEEGVTYDSEGALVISTGTNAYSYRNGIQIVDGFSISTDILFGRLDGSGCCTPRLVLVDGSRNMLALFTIKFSENFEILVDGEYNHSGNWTRCFGDGRWRSVQDNRVHVNLSRQPGSNSCYFSITDFGGNLVYAVSIDMPAGVARQIAGFGLGVDNSSARFTNMACKLSGSTSASDDMADYGLYSLEVGTPTTTDLWTGGEGITYNTEDALVICTDTNAYSYRNNFEIVDGFEIKTDILFGGLDSSGCSTPRIVLVDNNRNMVSLITIKFSVNNCDILVDGEYNYSGSWTHNLGDGQWRKVQDNRVHVVLSRAPDSNTLNLAISDFSGAEIFRQSVDMPAAVARQIAGFGLGADNSDARFSNISCSLSGRDSASDDVEDYGLIGITPGNETATTDWALEDGANYLDNDTLLIEGASVFAKDLNTTITNGFRISGNILFASLDDSNCSTARIALLNEKGDKVGIFTFKFSLNMDMMVTGEYDAGSGWVNCIGDTSWRLIQDNRLHFVLTREDNDTRIRVQIMDFSGNTIFDETCSMPYNVASQIRSYAVGVDNSKIQFSEVYATASDSVMDEQQMVPIVETGVPVGGSVWTSATGVSFYSDGSVILEATAGETYTYRTDINITDALSFRGKLQFGTLADDGTSTARVVFTDSSNSTIALFTVSFDKTMKVMAQGQYLSDGNWVTCIPDTGWQPCSGNIVNVELTRVSGSSVLMLQVKDESGITLITAFTSALPDPVGAAVRNLGIGCYNTKVKWSEMEITTESSSQGGVTEDGEESIVIDSTTTSPFWTGGNGIVHTTDGRIITSGNGDVYSYYTGESLTDSYTIRADIVFGEKAADGTSTARIMLADSEQSPVGLFTFKYDNEKKLRIEGQQFFGGSWTTLLAQEWTPVGTNHIVVSISKASDSKKWVLTVTKVDGTCIYSGSTADLSDEVLASVTCCGLGSYSSQVQFSEICITAE